MKTAHQVLQLCTDHLAQRGVEGPKRQAEELLAGALGIRRLDLYMDLERPLTEPELTRARERLKRRAQGEPLAYIEGVVTFYDAVIEVTPAVLIPRPETELLADRVAKRASSGVLWDVCCGSGCIGIALKKAHPELKVVLSDISSEALAVAARNAQRNGVDVELRQGDLLEPFKGEKANFIVCNPPYVTDAEWSQLDRSVRDFEPKKALVGGSDGLDFYRRLARDLEDFLLPDSQVWLEIGTGQGTAVSALFGALGRVTCDRDWSGHDRFVHLERNSVAVGADFA